MRPAAPQCPDRAAAPARRLCACALLAALLLAGCAAPPAQPVAQSAGAMMQDLAARQLFQGAVVLGRGGRVDYAAGFGFADIERQTAFTPDTASDGASIAKTFTAAALLALAAEGRIDLQAPVQTLLPAYPHADTRVRHLLAHSAGLPGYDWLDKRVPAGQVRSNASHLALVAAGAGSPAFVPGTAFSYDNLAYDVAAMLVERVEGAPYASVVARRFLQPLGLQAFLRPALFSDWPGPRTHGYRRSATGWQPNDAHDLEGFYGGSNLVLSARDLFRWAAGYGRLVGPATERAAMAPALLDDGRSTGITLGSWFASADGQRRYYTGSHNGFYCVAYTDTARDLALAWVANDTPPAWLQPALTRALIALAEGRTPEPLWAPAAAPTAADPSGHYSVAGVGELQVRREGRRVLLRLKGVDYQTFLVEPGVRYVPGLDAHLRFSATPDGRVALAWDSVYVVGTALAQRP